jgi:ABC-type lipoprotein release transport system permease subunit
LTAIVGVVLAITLIAGENITIDTTANSLLMEMLEFVPVDFTIKTNDESTTEILDTLTETRDVVRAEVSSELGRVTAGRWDTWDNTSITLYGIRPESEDYLIKMLNANYPTVDDYTGDMNIVEDGVVLQGYQADEIGVDVGDTVYLEYTNSWFNGTDFQNETHYRNLTVSGIIDIQISEGFQITDDFEFSETEFRLDHSFFNIADRSELVTALNISTGMIALPPDPFGGIFSDDSLYFANYTFYVWVDRDKFIVIGDVDKTRGNYVRMERALGNSLASIGMSEDDYSIEPEQVLLIIEAFNISIMLFRMGVLAVSLPAIALGIYLSLISIEVGMTRRRRELGILKARGATSRQLFWLLFTESIILGVIAGIIGLILGIFVSQIFLMLTPVASYFVENIYGIYISLWTILVAVIFSTVMIMIASYRPTKRIAGQPGVTMIRTRAEDELSMPYRATWDIIFIGLAIFTFSLMLILRFVEPEGLFAFLCILDLVLIVMTPLSAFFFIIGVTRLLTRGTTKIYDKMSRAVKFITKDMWYIVNRNIVRNPRRTSNICLLIAIGLAFGLVVSTYMETQYKYEERIIVGRIGGDLAVDVAWGTNLSFADNLTGVDGVQLLTPVVSLYTTTGENLYAFNSSAYYQIVQPEQVFFSEGDARQTIEMLKTEDNVLINEQMAKNQYLEVGDEYTTGVYASFSISNPEYHTFSIVGKVKMLPGLSDFIPIFVSSTNIYVDIDNFDIGTFGNGSSASLKFLIKVADGYEHTAVANDIKEISPSVISVSVLDEELQSLQQNPIEGALYNALMLIYFFVILIITFGLGLVVYVTIVEREHELAGFIARGASTKQVSAMLFGEGLTVMLVGLTIGILTGLFAAFMINELISFIFSGLFGAVGFEVAIERVFEVSWLSLALVVITSLALIVASFAATIRVRRINVAKALRERGG